MSDRPRLAVDFRALQVDGYSDRGVGRYTAAHTAALARLGRVAAVLLAPELPPPFDLAAELVQDDLLRWNCLAEARRSSTAGGRLAYYVPAPFLHSGPGEPAALGVSRHWAATGLPRVVTLYDLIPLRAPQHYLPGAGQKERYLQRARWAASADLILTISSHTRREAIELLGCDPAATVCVGAGVSSYFSPADGTDDQLWALHFGALAGRPYVLTVGGSDERKNMERLVDAFGLLAGRGWDLALVVVGALTPDWRNRLRDRAAAAGVADRVHLTGPVSDELLRACYRRAAVSVMPSLAEGSGLPVLESAACGVPALASGSTALLETAASPLARFDPSDAEAMADAVAGLLGDDGRRASVLAAQRGLVAESTWDAVAARSAAALDALADHHPAHRWRAARLPVSVALAGPLPPSGGGIGVYNERLLTAAAGAGDVSADFSAVVPGPTVPRVPPSVRYHPMDAVGHEFVPSSCDAVIYTVGNSDGHVQTVEMALGYPGWLWLHEARLPAVATTALAGVSDEEFGTELGRLLQRAYPGRAPLAAARSAGRSNLDLVRAGVGLIGPLAERCTGLLVNSQLARRMVQLDLAPLAWQPPIHVLPPACPPVRTRHRPEPGERHGPPLVVALGVVSMSKRPDVLVDAVARTGCRLAFVGPCPPILAQVIRERAELRHMDGRVTVCGSVDDDLWRAWMARADLAVQLRDVTGGETSAAVLESLSAGLPVLTNVASAEEMPDGVVSFLRGVDDGAIGERIATLIDSPSAREDLARAGMDFASEHTFERLAAQLITVVAGDGPLPSSPR